MPNQRSETRGPSEQQGSNNWGASPSSCQEIDQQWKEATRQGDLKGRSNGDQQHESQVQDYGRARSVIGGNHSQGSVNRDDRPVAGYYCNKCNKCIKSAGYTAEYTHEQHIADCWPGGAEGIDYVECRLCKFAALKITQHVRTKHNITKEEYEKNHGPVKCSSTVKAYSRVNKYNGDWISRKKEQGIDLTDYKKKMGAAVSRSIMSNPDERARRAITMAAVNRTEEARQKSSATAKITSARPEILEKRTNVLKKWRSENWELFYEKCIKKFSFSEFRMSNPEVCLSMILSNVEGYNFVWSQIVKSEVFENKSKRKQVDFGDKALRVYLEFDGIHHFKCFKEREEFERSRRNDLALDLHVESHGWTLIRISYDQYDSKLNPPFKSTCLQRLYEILQDPTPGVHRIGDAYNSGEQA